jgi:competence protein ComEC
VQVTIRSGPPGEATEAKGNHAATAADAPDDGDTSPRRRRRLPGAAAIWSSLVADLRADLDAGRAFAWAALLFGLGAAAYFALSAEPPAVAMALPAAALAGAALALRAAGARIHRVLVAAAMVAAGALAGKVAVDRRDGPVLEITRTATLEGLVLAVEDRGARGARLLVDVRRIDPPPREGTPRRVRIASRSSGPMPEPGARLRVLARLGPPQAPVYPGGYDFGRAAFFAGIGGVGFTMGPVEIVAAEGPADAAARALVAVERFRAGLSQRIRTVLPGDPGAVAAALVVGDRASISAATDEAMRVSGLSHVLSISGLHMALVAAFLFAGLRAALALVPPLALALPIKSIAAVAALAGTLGYMVIAGMNLATQRSAVMIAVSLVAVLAGRRPFSMRAVAVAAFVVVAVSPQAVLDPGAQMSFAAVAALVAGYEALAARREGSADGGDVDPVVRVALTVARFVGLSLLTSLIAGAATAPIAAHHFNRAAPLGLLANLLATPIVSFLIMPAGLVAALAMPFDLEAWPLRAMGLGIEGMILVARLVAEWTPGGGMVGRPPVAATLTIVAGGLWLCLWTRRARHLGWIAVGLGIALALTTGARPDLVVAGDGRRAMVRTVDSYRLVGRPDDFETPIWLAAVGDARPADDPTLVAGTRCDPEACILAGAGPAGDPADIGSVPPAPATAVDPAHRDPADIGSVAPAPASAVDPARRALSVAVVFRPEAFVDECGAVDVVVAAIPAPDWCRALSAVVDRDDLDVGGARTFSIDVEGTAPRGLALAETGRAIPPRRRPFDVGAP